jgi:phosphoglycolate phosphatase-like HAD superfamily hydrolase
MVILLDLDGTLTDTTNEKFKPFKDGLKDFEVSEIPVFQGAIEFVTSISKKHFVFIVSDSHPNYVNKIASKIFGLTDINSNDKINKSSIDYISNQVIYLADKPNIERTYNHLIDFKNNINSIFPMISQKENKDQFIMIGDSWLDIELGRRLNIRTILTQFYKAEKIEVRDGIGQDWKPIKMGPSYYAKNFNDILKIIENPNKELLSLEAIFQNENSVNSVKFLYRNYNGNFTAYRCLARQEDGECDRFARADKYYQIDNPQRNKEFISMLAQSITNYLSKLDKSPEYKWDYLTYVTDKKTTIPPNKMKEIFELVNTKIEKIKIFEWSEEVQGSLRNQPNYQTRREFISKYLKTIEGIDLDNKSIIVIDDQFTSSATANEISQQLRNKGVKNILFIALFYLILPIESKLCPNIIGGKKCGKPLKIKINKKDGNKFYSCTPPQFKGTGCGYTEKI